MRELDKMDKLDAELRGEYHHELKVIDRSLTDEQRRELCALMWYGRNDGDLDYCRRHAIEVDPSPGYIFGNPLDYYLPAALIKLGLLCDDGGEA